MRYACGCLANSRFAAELELHHVALESCTAPMMAVNMEKSTMVVLLIEKYLNYAVFFSL